MNKLTFGQGEAMGLDLREIGGLGLTPRELEVLRVGLEEGINAALRGCWDAGVTGGITVDIEAAALAAGCRLMGGR